MKAFKINRTRRTEMAAGPELHPLPQIAISDIELALGTLAKEHPPIVMEFFLDGLREKAPSLTGRELVAEILAMGAMLLWKPEASTSSGDQRPHSNG